MSNNIEVKIVADSSPFTAQMAVAAASLKEYRAQLAQAVKASGDLAPAQIAASASVQQAAANFDVARAKVAALREQMRASTETAKGFGGAFEEVRSGLGRIGEVTGIAAAVEGVRMLGEGIEKLGERATEMHTLAAVLGVNTDELQAMQHAAEESGVGMDVLAHAGERLTNTLSEARNGTGSAIEKLHALGITTKEINDPTFQLNDLLGVLRARLNDVNAAEATRKALLQDLGARGALAVVAIKEYDGSLQAVQGAMKAVNGLSGEQISRLQEMKAWWSNLGTEIMNAASKAAVFATKDFSGGEALLKKKSADGPGRSTAVTGEQEASQQQAQAAQESARQQEAIHNELIKNEMEANREAVAAYAEGTAQRLAMDRQYAALAKEFYGSDNVAEVRRANSEVLAAERASHDTQGREAIAEAKTEAQGIAAESGKGAMERLEAEKAVWSRVLSGDRLNNQQRLEAAREFAAEYAAETKQAAEQAAAVTRINVQSDIAVSKLQLEAQKASLDAQVAATKEAVAQKYAALKAATEQETQLDLDQLEKEKAGLNDQSADYAKVCAEIRELKARLTVDLAKLDQDEARDAKKATEEQASDWKKAVGEITTAESGMVSDLLNKRKSLSQSLVAVGAQMVTQELSNDLRATTMRLMLYKESDVQQKALEQGGFLYHQAMDALKLASTTKQVAGQNAAVNAGNTAQQTSTAAAMNAGQAMQSASAERTVMSDAAVSYAGTYASVAAIPYVGYLLAPAAAEGAFSAVASMAGLAALATGTNFVPQDMPAFLHKGEAVVPKAYNPAAGAGGGGDAVSSGGGDTHHNYNGSMSITHGDIKSMLSSPSDQHHVVKTLASAYRRGARVRI